MRTGYDLLFFVGIWVLFFIAMSIPDFLKRRRSQQYVPPRIEKYVAPERPIPQERTYRDVVPGGPLPFFERSKLPSTTPSPREIMMAQRRAEEARQQEEHDRRLRALQLADIDRMSGVEFERYIERLLQHQGYNQVKHTGGSGDGGVDLVAEKDGEKVAIQAKRQQAAVPGVAISAPVAGKVLYNCSRVMVITSSSFTLGAVKLAKANDVELVDREMLAGWIANFQDGLN